MADIYRGIGVVGRYLPKKKIDTEYQSKSSFEGADASGIEAWSNYHLLGRCDSISRPPLPPTCRKNTHE